MNFAHPWWFFLALSLVAVFWFSLPRTELGKRTLPKGLVRVLLWLRLVGLACLIAAMAGPSLILPSQRQDVALLIDVSASQGPDLVEQSRKSAQMVVESLDNTDQVTLIVFAARSRVLAGPTDPAEMVRQLNNLDLSLPESDQTDINSALQLAAARHDTSAGQAVWWLFSDGQATQGDNLSEVVRSPLPGRIYVLPQGRPSSALASLALETPAIIRPGELATIIWKVQSPVARTLKVRLLVDGEKTSEQSVSLKAGDNQIQLALPSVGVGTHQVDLLPLDLNGQPLSAATISALVVSAGQSQVLIIKNADTLTTPLAAVLTAQGMQVRVENGGQLPSDVAGYDGLGAVVFDNLPARDLDGRQLIALQSYVSSGGGLLVVGGDQSLGRGEYFASPLEELLPVHTDHRQRLFYNRTRILFVVDHSGSMSETVGAITKLEAAIQGVLLSLDQLKAQDEVAVLTFDSEPSWALDFTPARNRTVIERALANLPSGGGTDMAKAMQEVVARFGQPGPFRRHVIFLTDGETGDTEQGFQEMAERLASLDVSITTIGIGDTINQELLTNLARWGNGTFYRANGDQIPRILKQDTIQFTRALIQEGRFVPTFLQKGGLLGDLTKLPPLLGYLLTRPKAQATVWLAVANPNSSGAVDPILTGWHYGSGQVAVFSADSGSRWLADWSGTTSLNKFWAGLVRGLEVGQRDQGLHLTVSVQASVAHLDVEALDADRQLRSGLALSGWMDGHAFSLVETAPGHYQTKLPLSGGLHQFRVSDHSNNWTSSWAWNPNRAEDNQGGINLVALVGLAKATGGEVRSVSQPGTAQRRDIGIPVTIGLWFIVLGVFLLVFDLGLRSTLLGQMAMAAAILRQWWKGQRLQVRQAASNQDMPKHDSEGADHNRVMNAYRYLAQRSQARARSNTPGPFKNEYQ